MRTIAALGTGGGKGVICADGPSERLRLVYAMPSTVNDRPVGLVSIVTCTVAWFTTCFKTAEVLLAKPELPKYVAVNECEPGPSHHGMR